jgi:phage tail-like protein
MTSDHLLLNRQAGWHAAALNGVTLAQDGAVLQLRTLPGALRPLVDTAGSFGGLALPTGLAVDGEDRVYILDGAGGVLKRYDPCTGLFEALPCIGGTSSQPRNVCEPHGLALGSRGTVYLADTGNRRVQVFAEKGLALRAVWGPYRVRRDDSGAVTGLKRAKPYRTMAGDACLPDDAWPVDTWQPWDIALTGDDHAYISDTTNGLIHLFDRRGRWRASFDGTAGGGTALDHPTHIALDRDCNLYVIQADKDYLVVLDAEGNFIEQIDAPEGVGARFCPLAVGVDEAGNIYLSERLTRRVHLFCPAADGGKPIYAGTCRDFKGLGLSLAFDSAGSPLIADGATGHVAQLDPGAIFNSSGTYISDALDSLIHNCTWHRVVLQTDLAPGTRVHVATFTSSGPREADEIAALPAARWTSAAILSQVGSAPWDCLIRSAPGRYLWLRLMLEGDGTATPAIHQAQVYFPRETWLNYLPAVYREDAVSADFLDRFLALFEALWDTIGQRVEDIAGYFDPDSTPAAGAGPGATDFLSWLASWLGLALDRQWPEERRRRLVKYAHQLYRQRGTPEGLRLHIELYTGLKPYVLEHFKLRRWLSLNYARLGDQSVLWGDAIMRRLQLDEFSRIGDFQLIDSGDPLHDPFYQHAHQFSVFVPLPGGADDRQRQTLRRIVEMAKPAHTQGHVQIVRPRLRVGVQSFIGIDTVIGCYPDEVVLDEGQLGKDTVLGPSEEESQPPTLRVGRQFRIGSGTLID